MRYVVMILAGALCAAVCLYAHAAFGPPAAADEQAEYIGSDGCGTCHTQVAADWALSSHRRAFFNKQDDANGCEACHGPGSLHSQSGDKSKIIRMSKESPEQIARACLKCHKQEHLTLWQSSLHARAKVTCLNCHDPHSPSTAMMAKDVENGKAALDGLTRSIKAAELAASDAAVGSKEKETANAEAAKLKLQADALREKVKAAETVYHRSADPYVCYSCHKVQQAQMKMPSHHPVVEGKMKCTECHNPHGGPNGMLKAESVNESCFKCHAEKAGPFTFEHPPVTENCSTCHSPHGSVNNNLLTQSEPFLCLKCHPGPHSRSGALGQPAVIPYYYTECTDCHNQVHGSDEHSALHY